MAKILNELDKIIASLEEQELKKNPAKVFIREFFENLKNERAQLQVLFQQYQDFYYVQMFPGDGEHLRMLHGTVEFLDLLIHKKRGELETLIQRLHRKRHHSSINAITVALSNINNGRVPEGTNVVEKHLRVLRNKLSSI